LVETPPRVEVGDRVLAQIDAIKDGAYASSICARAACSSS